MDCWGNHLFPDSPSLFDNKKQFLRSDFTGRADETVEVNVKYSKTNQFHKRNFVLRLFHCDHKLDATRAIHNAFKRCPLPPHAPAFMASESVVMTGKDFNRRLKEAVAATGADASNISSHSLRRGGACWALQCGFPGEIVQQLGDWQSDCYKKYLDKLPQQVHDHYRKLFCQHFPTV